MIWTLFNDAMMAFQNSRQLARRVLGLRGLFCLFVIHCQRGAQRVLVALHQLGKCQQVGFQRLDGASNSVRRG